MRRAIQLKFRPMSPPLTSPNFNFDLVKSKTRRNAINVRPKSTDGLFFAVIDSFCHYEHRYYPARWPSGLRRQTKDLVSSGAWVRIPLSSVLSTPFFSFHFTRRFRSLEPLLYSIIHNTNRCSARHSPSSLGLKQTVFIIP